MAGIPLLEAWQDWECPNCGLEERTRPRPNRFHPCPKLHGLTAPLVLAGTDCTVTAVERGDYLAGAEQRTGDDGRPYMAVQTVYGDGRNDVAAFAEVAIARFGGQRA
jgi:hypothetical protein